MTVCQVKCDTLGKTFELVTNVDLSLFKLSIYFVRGRYSESLMLKKEANA